MSKKFKYIDTAERILADIGDGLSPGDLLPLVPEMKARYGISEITIKKALSMLAERGIVKRTQKKGTVLLRLPEEPTHHPLGREKTLRVLTLNSPWVFSDYIETLLKRYNAVNKTVTYRTDRIGRLDNYQESLRSQRYDLALVGTRLTGQMTLDPALAEAFEAIDDIPGLWFDRETLFPGVTRWCEGKRGLMCLPFYFSTTLDRVNLDYPLSDKRAFAGGMPLPEYLDTLRRVVRARHGALPAPFYLRINSFWPIVIRLLGGRFFSDDYQKCLIDSPETHEGLQLILDMIYRDKLCPPPGFEKDLQTQEIFKTGKFLRAWMAREADLSGGDFKSRFVALPVGRETMTALTWVGAMVPKGARLDLVRDFLNFSRLPDNARAMPGNCPGIPCEKTMAKEHMAKMNRQIKGFSLFLDALNYAEPLNNAPDPMLIDHIRRAINPVFMGMETPEQACAKIAREIDVRLQAIFSGKDRRSA